MTLYLNSTIYVALAAAYGGTCIGLDKTMINLIITGLYLALAVHAARKGH